MATGNAIGGNPKIRKGHPMIESNAARVIARTAYLWAEWFVEIGGEK